MHEQNNIYFAGTTRDNQNIFYTEKGVKRFTDEQKKLIAEALPHITYKYFPLIYTFSFNRLVGITSLVEVEDDKKDCMFWVYRKSKTKWKVPAFFSTSPISPRWTTYMTMIFQRRGEKIFVVTCYFGKRVPPLPCNPIARVRGNAFVESCQEFWRNHALIINPNDIDIERTLETLNAEESARFLNLINA